MPSKAQLPIDPDTQSVDNAKLEAERDRAFRYNQIGLRAPRDPGSLLTPRPAEDMSYKATLLKGSRYAISYRAKPLIFERGVPVEINESEFAHLRDHADVVTYQDSDGSKYRRYTRRFAFTTLDGDPVDLPELPDERIEMVDR